MGNSGSREAGNLTKVEIERLKRRFERQAGKSRRLASSEFQRIPELSGNFFAGRIFGLADKDEDGFITAEDFLQAVETVVKIYSEEEKIRFAFGLYDLDKDGYISQLDLLGVLQHTARGNVNRQQLDNTVATLLQEYDVDKDGLLSFSEFARLAAAGGPEPRPFLG